MGSWEQSPFSFFMSYNAACNYFMMTLISHSFIKVTSTIFSDFFFILVDFLALKRGGGVEGLKREWNGYSILELPLTQTQSTKLLVIFSSPKALHWKTARVKQLCRNLLVFLSACSGSGWGGCRCWPSIHRASQAGGSWEVKASIHDLSVGSFFPSLLLTFLSQQKAARLPQSRRDIFNERMLNFHQAFSSDVGLPCHIPPARLLLLRTVIWVQGIAMSAQGVWACGPAPTDTSFCHWAPVIPGACVCVVARSFSPRLLYIWKLQMSTVRALMMWKADLNNLIQKRKKRRRKKKKRDAYCSCRVQLDGNKSSF